MAKVPHPSGFARLVDQQAWDEENEASPGYPEGYREPEAPEIDLAGNAQRQQDTRDALLSWVEETTTGLTDEEKNKKAADRYEAMFDDPAFMNRAGEGWAAEGTRDDSPSHVLYRALMPKKTVYQVPGSVHSKASYEDNKEAMMYYQVQLGLQESEGVSKDEAIARAYESPVARHEGSGKTLEQRVISAESMVRPGTFGAVQDLINESALGSVARGAAGLFSYLKPSYAAAPVAERYYGEERSKRWWRERDVSFNSRVVYPGHPAEKAHKNVAHPDTGEFRPWYETVQIRAGEGTASDEELKTYDQYLEERNNIATGKSSFIDTLGQYIQQRDAFLEQMDVSGQIVGSLASSWMAQPSDWVSARKQRGGVKLSLEEIREGWDDIDTYPTDKQLHEDVKAVIDVWRARDGLKAGTGQHDEITRRLNSVVQQVRSDMWPDKRLRIVSANELGEAPWATSAGHFRKSPIGDYAMIFNPVFQAVDPGGPSLDFTSAVGAMKASKQHVNQISTTLAKLPVLVGNARGLDTPSNFGESITALWGSGFARELKGFFENEKLFSDDVNERKSFFIRMFYNKSRAEIHVNEFLLDVPEFSEFKNEFLETQDWPVLPPQSLSIYIENSDVLYQTPAVYSIMQGAKERAKEERMTLEEYVGSDDGWETIEKKLNKVKLYTLPGKIASGILKKMGGYEGVRRDINVWTEGREKAFGRQQAGEWVAETLNNAMSNSHYEGTNLIVEQSATGMFLQTAGELAAGPIFEIAADVIFDPALAVGEQFGLWNWDGRAHDRGTFGDWFVGIEDPDAAGAYGRGTDIARGLGYDETDDFFKATQAVSLFFDFVTPVEGMFLTGLTRPVVGLHRLNKMRADMPGLRLSLDTTRAAFAPDGVYGLGSLWKKIAPVEDIADYQKAVDTAKVGAAERRADTVERLGRRDLREVAFGDSELNLAKKRLKGATRQQQGLLGWRRAVGLDPRRLTKEFGGMHDVTSLMAGELFAKNLLQGRSPLEGFGPQFRSNVFEVMRRGGIAAEDVNRVLKDSSKMRTAKFLSEAGQRLDSVDDYTKGIRESDSYVRLRDELEAANQKNPLSYKSLHGIDVVDSLMAMIETQAVGLARVRGIEDGAKAIDAYMQSLLSDIGSGRAVEPPRFTGGPGADDVGAAIQSLSDTISTEQLGAVDIDLANKAQIEALRSATQFEAINAVGDRAALRTLAMGDLVLLLSRVTAKGEIVADLLGEVSHRLAKEFADFPLEAQSKFDEFVELLSAAEDELLAKFTDQESASAVRSLFDSVLDNISERVNRARQTLDDATEPRAPGFQQDAGQAQIAQSIRALAEKDFFEADQASVLEALVMSLPERVLRDIRLNDQITDIAQGAAARTTELLAEGGAVDRLISSVEFFGYADEIGALKAAEGTVLIGANLDEIFEAIRFKRDERKGFQSVAIRFLSDRKNPKTGKSYTARELAERYVDSETWMKRQEGEVFSPEKVEQLVSQFEEALNTYKRGADRVGPRTYQFLHELGHGVAMSFLADSEIAILSKAFRDELDDFGLFRDTPYTRSFDTMSDIQFNEWFAENFAEFVISHRLPDIVATQRGAGDLLRIFNNLMERMSNWFSSWFRREPRARTDFHPALALLVDRLFDDKAAAMASRREVALRRATAFQARLSDEGVFSPLSRQRAGLDGQYIPDLDEVEFSKTDKKPLPASDRSAIFEETTDYEAFEKAKAKSERGVNLSPKTPEEYQAARIFLSPDHTFGFMVDSTGDLQNVFSNSPVPGMGKFGVFKAIEELDALTLDCYDDFLPEYYSQFGFVEVARLKFVDDYAPDGWDYDSLGRPDIVIMSYQGGDRGTIRSRYKSFEYRKTEDITTDFGGASDRARKLADPPRVEGVLDGQDIEVKGPGVGEEIRGRSLGEEQKPSDVGSEKSNVPTDVGLGELTLGDANAAMRQTKTGTDLAEFISKNADDPVHRRIADRIKPHLGDTEVHVIEKSSDIPESIFEAERKGSLPPEVALSIAIISAHESRLRRVTRGLNWSPAGDAFNDVFLRGNEAFSGTTAETALHELVHAATVRRLSDGNLPANKGTKLQSASNELYALVNDVIKLAKKAQTEKSLDPATEAVLISATGSVKEFVAYGLTNKKFQDYLMTIKVEDKSMWNVFVEKIADLLGVAKKDHNALIELVRVTDELLDAPLSELPSRSLTEYISLMEEPVKKAGGATESIEMQILLKRAAEAEESLNKSNSVGMKRLYERRLNTANRRIEDLKESQSVIAPTETVAAGSFDLLDIDGAADRLGPEIRRVLSERDVLDSGQLSEELSKKFDPSSEKIGGTPHDIVDFESDLGLKQRVYTGEITSHQAKILKERLGSATPLEDISTDVMFEVERIVQTPEGAKIERSTVAAPVAPMLKATGFGGEQGMKVLIPGGKEGVFSFADVQYLARRPVEMIIDEAATKWWDDVGEQFFGEPDLLGNFDGIIDQYKEAYATMLNGLYDKLHNGYGLENRRPDIEDFFSENRFINNEARSDWGQQIEVHLMDVASQYVFAFLSMQTNLLDNQVFAAVARPRSMADLADTVQRARSARINKGSPLSRDEANHILGFSVTISSGILKGRFGKKQILLDVETDILPIIEVRDWTKPGGPLIRVQSADIAPLNAQKIAAKARKSLARYVKFKKEVAKIEARIPTIKDAAKRRRAKTQLKKAVKEMESADMAHRAVLNSVSSTDVIALTGDVVLSSPADTTKLLDMYEMMYEDFIRVQRGELKQSFFERYPDEAWDDFSDRVSSMVPGMATKISAFGIYWQNPISATIGALDIHMIGLVGKALLKEELWIEKARVWHRDWQTIKSKAAKDQLKETAELQLMRESKKTPSSTAIDRRAKEIIKKQRKFRESVPFERFLEADKSNPGYTFWRDQLRVEITAPEKLRVHPIGVPEYKKAFPVNVIDSKKVRQAISDVKANSKLDPEQRADRVRRLEVALRAHEHIESAAKRFGSDHPIIDRFIEELSTGSSKFVEVMSPDYKKVLEGMSSDVNNSDILGSVATRQHRVWDEWRGYLDPHVIVQPGSAMLPAVRPAALKTIIKSLEGTFPEIRDPRVQADLTSRHSRLVSGLFGAGFRDLHSSLKEGGFGGTAPFKDRPLPTELTKGALYMKDIAQPSTPLHTLISAGRDLSDLFNTGDASVLFRENGTALLYLMGQEFPEMMEVFTNKFDSIVSEAGVEVLTPRGYKEVNEAFVDFWHSRYVDDPQVDVAFENIRDKMAVFWRRVRHRADRTNPEARRFFDEWLGVLNDAKKEAMFDVSGSAEFKSIPRITRKEDLLQTESVSKAGRAKEATRIDLDEGRIRHALDLGEGVTDVDAFETMQKAVEYVSREMSRTKYTNNWLSFSTRTIVPARSLARYLEEAQLETFRVFGDPHVLKKQFKTMAKERVKLDRFGDPIIDADGLPEMEVVTEALPDGTTRPVEIVVIELTELQQDKLKSLLIELSVDLRTKGPVKRVLGEYFGPRADLSVIPESHYHFITQEMIRDHVVGVGTGLTKEVKRVPKSLGYAAVKAVVDSSGFRALGGETIVRTLKKQFKTRAPLAHIRKSKAGKELGADTEVVSPIIKELFMRRSRQIDDIPNWISRVQIALKEGRMSAGVWETLEGLKEILEQPLSNAAYRTLDSIEVLFDAEKGISPTLIASKLDEIQIAFADNRLINGSERKAIELLREIERIKRTEPERTVLKNGLVEIKDPVMREAIAEAYLIVSDGIARRLVIADTAAETIMKGMGGSPEQAKRLFNPREDVYTDRALAIEMYSRFYHGEWGQVLELLQEKGLATGTALKHPGRYNVGHAMLETIIRLRAQSIFRGLLDDMTEMGVAVKIEDLAPLTIESIVEKRAFAERVKMYLDQELEFGGPLQLVDESGKALKLTGGFEGPRILAGEGTKLQGAGPGSGKLSKKARERLSKLGGYSRPQVAMGDVVTKVVVQDLEAYTVAQDLIERWGMKRGANIKEWEVTRFVDGSEAIVPKLLLNEIDDAIDRIAGTASARAGKSRLKIKRENVPEIGVPEPPKILQDHPLLASLYREAADLKKDYFTTADLLNYMSNTFQWTYRMTKMGLTSGIFMVNLPYYVANAFGAQLQVYQKVGLRGYFSSMSHPVISLEVAASLWGRNPTMRFTKVKPVVTPDGTVWSQEAITRACHEHGLSGSFLSVETARSIAVDLKRNEPSFWNKMTKETEAEKRPHQAAGSPGAAGLDFDLPGPLQAVRFYHNQLINFATFIDNYHRVALFTEGIGRGLSPADAAASARSALFDYSDLTDFEKKYMRQIFIFYSFQRKNLDLFWDTVLTNPHRVMGQLRVARGVNQIYLDGDETLIESEWSIGRLGAIFANNAAKDTVQKNRYNAPILPVVEAMKGQLDFFSFMGSFLPTDNILLKEKRMKNQLKFMARLNPWIQAPMAATIQKEFFSGKGMRPERIPTFWAQHDLMTNGGMLLNGVGGSVRAIKGWEEQEFPGQSYVWEATNTMNWYILQNAWHGPVPVMPMREDTPGTSWMGAVGEAIDYTPLGAALRAQPIKGFKEGTLGVGFAGRMIDSLSRFGRADMIIPQLLDADMAYYRKLVDEGKRDKLFEFEKGDKLYQKLNASALRIDPETGDVDFQVTPEGSEIRGGQGRVGVDEGWLAILLGVQQIPTKDRAILMHYYRQQNALDRATKEVRKKFNDKALDLTGRYESEGSD